MKTVSVTRAYEAGVLRDLDYHFAMRMSGQQDDPSGAVALAAVLVSHALSEGHTCIDLRDYAGQKLFAGSGFDGFTAPAIDIWTKALAACDRVGSAGTVEPLMLEDYRLYLGRYWYFETQLAQTLKRMAKHREAVDSGLLRQGLLRYFPQYTEATDYQALAAMQAVMKKLLVISGGPGTGKTHTVASIIALLLEQAEASKQSLRIALAAPTGKAAARMTTALRRALAGLPVAAGLREKMQLEAQTVHRLLGMRPDRVIPKYHVDNRLHLDVLIVDEASMLDLPLMYWLATALPDNASLILMGDRHQLAAVESGNVFADLCRQSEDGRSAEFVQMAGELGFPVLETAGTVDTLTDHVALLHRSYRFDQNSGIGRLATAVNQGDAKQAQALLSDKACADIEWQSATAFAEQSAVMGDAVEAYLRVVNAADIDQALGLLDEFRVLCAVRQGRTGVESVNGSLDRALRSRLQIDSNTGFYPGMPVMVTRNDYQNGLFNGDVGLVWPDESGVVKVWFRMPDNSLKGVLPGQLPLYELAFALTVHKSQGSEFARVLLLLPEKDSPVLTRELLYTGITRAVKQMTLLGSPGILETAVKRVVKRSSGLAGRLSGNQE